MITKETLEIINNDLDAELNQRVSPKKVLRHKVQNVKNMNTNPTITNQEEEQHEINEPNLSKVNVEETDHMKLLKKIGTFFHNIGLVFGCDLNIHWKPWTHVMVYGTCFFLGFGIFSIFRMQYIHFRNGDYFKILELCSLWGMATSCVQKWYGTLTKYKKMASLLHSSDTLCRQNPVGRRAEILKTGLERTIFVLKCYFAGVCASILMFCAYPIKLFIVDGIKATLFPMDLMYANSSTVKGYIATNLAQSNMGIEYALATIMYASVFMVSICFYATRVELVAEDFKDLDKMWDGTSFTSVAYRHAFLYNICKKFQDMKVFLGVVKSVYRYKLFVYFVVNYISQIVCLFEITINDWIPGIPLAIILFIEMGFYCYLGTQISIADDKLCEHVYNTNWYVYDLKSKRVMRSLLHISQRSNEIILGPVGRLNIVTFISVVKSILSYYTVLKEFV